MIAFEIIDYLRMCFSALIFGMEYSIFECLGKCVLFFSRAFMKGVYDGVFYKGRLLFIEPYTNIPVKFNRVISEIFAALRVCAFTLGMIILSYFILDGELRLFAIVISLIGFTVFSKYLSPLIFRLLKGIFSLFLRLFVLAMRLALFIPRRITYLILHIFDIICRYLKQNNRYCKLFSIDKKNKKC